MFSNTSSNLKNLNLEATPSDYFFKLFGTTETAWEKKSKDKQNLIKNIFD